MLDATTWASFAGAYFPVLLLLIGVLLIASWKNFHQSRPTQLGCCCRLLFWCLVFGGAEYNETRVVERELT